MTFDKLKTAGKTVLAKLKTDRRALILLCAGLALLVLIAFSDLRPEKARQNTPAQPQTAAQPLSEEERLRSLLRNIRGAGNAEVMIIYSEQAQFVYAAASDIESETLDGGQLRQKEKRDPVILKDAQTQTGLVERTLSPRVQGVAVVCEGASDPTVRAQIVSAVSALFGLGINHISVAEMASQEEPS